MAGERRLYLGSDATDARYLIEDPGPNGDFVITDLDDGSREVLRYDSVNAIAEVLDLSVEQLVGASGAVVYDDATQTVGDGTTSANHESVSTGEASIANVAATGYQTSDQSISNAFATKVVLDQSELDSTNVLSVDLTNNRIDIEADGTYIISGHLMYAGNAAWSTGSRAEAQVRINGGADGVNFLYSRKTGTADEGFNTGTYVAKLVSGDTVSLWAYQDSGSAISLVSGSSRVRLSVGRLG